MAGARPAPGRRTPLPVVGEPGSGVDVEALFRRFEQQDRVLLAERDRADRLTTAVSTLHTVLGEVVTELDSTRVQVTVGNAAAGGRIAAVTTRVRELVTLVDQVVPENRGRSGTRTST